MSEGYYQEEKKKAPGTAVYPMVRSRVELLKGMVADYVLGAVKYNRSADWGDPKMVGAGWMRFVYACRVISEGAGDTGFDFHALLQEYDKINNTVSVLIQDDTVSSIPVYDDPAEGFRPMGLWEKVKYFDGTSWVDRWVSDIRRKGDCVELADSDDPEGADVELVPMTQVTREYLRPSKASAPEPKVELVWEN